VNAARAHPTTRTLLPRRAGEFPLRRVATSISSSSDRSRRIAVGAAFAAALIVALAAATPATATEVTPLQQAADNLVAAGVPGVVLLVRDNGERPIRISSGYGNLAKGTPISVTDRFRVASLTKTFVATVVLQLVGEGRLRLDDTVERWLPGLFPDGDAITVYQLLNHTSGIYDAQNDPAILAPYFAGDLTHFTPPRMLVEVAAAHELLFPPGSNWSYSNANYFVLGLIVEAATGHTIGFELRHRIFRRLELRDTTFPRSPRIPGPHAHGYFLFGQPPLQDFTVFSPSLFWAGGAIVSTAGDIARFYRALLRGRLLGRGLLKKMLTIDPVALDPSGSGSGFGLGIQREGRFPCGEAWGHDGELPGFEAFAWNTRDGTRQVVVLINTSGLSENAGQALTNLLVTAYCSR
jgi:D-alanyl-D-alanine carboxypeptidase